MKVTVVGAGAVGASCAEYIAMKDFAAEVVLVDIKEGFAEGKAMDLMQTASLIGINAGIVKDVTANLVKHSPNVIIIVVSNPMDTMAYLVHKTSGLPKNQIIGMGGALDSARFKYRLAEALECPISDVDGMVIAAHSDTGMLPLMSKATRNGVPVTEFLDEAKQDHVAEETKVGGATLTKLLGTSAWYAPGAAVSLMLDGEYGESDICLGVPAIIGKNGVEKIVEINLTDAEKEKFATAAKAVREVNGDLKF